MFWTYKFMLYADFFGIFLARQLFWQLFQRMGELFSNQLVTLDFANTTSLQHFCTGGMFAKESKKRRHDTQHNDTRHNCIA
jgi:hypothetical protein